MKYINENKYRIITLMVALVICLVVIYIHLLSHEKTQEIYLEQTEKTIVELKKDFLKDTLVNVFIEIDALRETKYNNYKKNTESRLLRFQEKMDLTEAEFIDYFISNFKDDLNPKMWTAFLWDNQTGEVLYSSVDLERDTIETTLLNLESILSNQVSIQKGNIKGVFGVNKLYIDETVKKEVADGIRNRKFSNDSYIWVNEVINYEGGENYAIRRVHPNLIETEGDYLSTETQDIKGNLPYLTELEGIKKNGEVFSTYYFKKLASDEISEKLTYARLYKDYNWIIAMGDHLDDIQAYTEKTNAEINSLSSVSIIHLLGYIFLVLLIGFTILYFIAKNYISNSTRSLEKEINLDTLTKAASRRSGEISLNNYFKNYLKNGENPAIMMFDIDDFKVINDKYGHEVGDNALKEIVDVVNQNIRSSDQVIRWGGDEFVGILPGLRREHIMEFGSKLLDGISSINIQTENETINLTISIGFSYFKEVDKDYSDVLKRADNAMYKSKEEGKNTVNII